MRIALGLPAGTSDGPPGAACWHPPTPWVWKHKRKQNGIISQPFVHAIWPKQPSNPEALEPGGGLGARVKPGPDRRLPWSQDASVSDVANQVGALVAHGPPPAPPAPWFQRGAPPASPRNAKNVSLRWAGT